MNNFKVEISELEKVFPSKFLGFTDVLDGGSPIVRDFFEKNASDAKDVKNLAVKLFYAVRDGIKYTMYAPFFYREDYKASSVIKRGVGYCVQKAVVLTTLYRVAGIPAGLIFADIRNHKAPKIAYDFMGTNIFTYHGYVAVYLGDKWLKVTPAFDIETSRKGGYPPVEFDGENDAVFSSADTEGNRFMEYLKIHGVYFDLALDELLQSWRKVYGEERVALWEKMYHEVSTGLK